MAREGIFHEMARQTRQAVDEADAVLFVVDARAGLAPQDRAIASELRKSGRRIFLVVNKAEGMEPGDWRARNSTRSGLGDPLAGFRGARRARLRPHGSGARGTSRLRQNRLAEQARHPRIAIVGRPNVGKSTLVNALLGEERVIVFDQPGTTRDSISCRIRARRPPLHADRYRRPAPARARAGGAGEVLGGEDAAGDRGCQCRDPGARRAAGHLGAGCAHRRLHPRSRARAGGGGQQVGAAARRRSASR